MSKTKRHLNKLKDSRAETVRLCFEVQRQFLELLEAHVRIKGIQIFPPKDLDADMVRWRQMAVRFRKGDYRNTEAELHSLESIAQWNYEENCKLRNQDGKIHE